MKAYAYAHEVIKKAMNMQMIQFLNTLQDQRVYTRLKKHKEEDKTMCGGLILTLQCATM